MVDGGGGTSTCLQLGYTWQKTPVTKSYIRETFKIWMKAGKYA